MRSRFKNNYEIYHAEKAKIGILAEIEELDRKMKQEAIALASQSHKKTKFDISAKAANFPTQVITSDDEKSEIMKVIDLKRQNFSKTEPSEPLFFEEEPKKLKQSKYLKNLNKKKKRVAFATQIEYFKKINISEEKNISQEKSVSPLKAQALSPKRAKSFEPLLNPGLNSLNAKTCDEINQQMIVEKRLKEEELEFEISQLEKDKKLKLLDLELLKSRTKNEYNEMQLVLKRKMKLLENMNKIYNEKIDVVKQSRVQIKERYKKLCERYQWKNG